MDNLTMSEKKVFHELVKGLSNKEIAENLGIQVGTIKSHLTKIFAKYGVENRTKLLKKFYQGEKNA